MRFFFSVEIINTNFNYNLSHYYLYYRKHYVYIKWKQNIMYVCFSVKKHDFFIMYIHIYLYDYLIEKLTTEIAI